MSREIDNLTDQLDGFAMEVVRCIRSVEREGFTREQAIEITKIAVEDVKTESIYQIYKALKKY